MTPEHGEDFAGEIANLKGALAKARRDNRAYQDLLIAAAHEMRTPLHAIGLHLEMLATLSSGENAPAQRAQVERAKRVLSGYVQRTSMLLDAARVTAGVYKLKTEPVALDELVPAVVELYAAKAEFQHSTVTFNIASRIVGQWDRAAVETILANLVSNALKYGEGAPVTISATTEDLGHAVIRVTDLGPGVPENQRDHIFEQFTRAESDSAVVGFGLGLWIADQLARLHGGSIILEPAGGGSTFVVTLPVESKRL